MIFLRISLLFYFAFVLFFNTFAQQMLRIGRTEFKHENEGFAVAWDNLKRGDDLFLRGKAYYNEAVRNYLKAHSYNAENAELNYRIGVCYLFADNKLNAEEYLLKAYNANNQLSSDILLLLGMAAQQKSKFEEAKQFYVQYEQTLSPRDFEQQIRTIEKLKMECDTAQFILKTHVNARVENLGDSINSIYADYCPLITADARKMLFSSQRYGATGGKFNSYTNAYNEDVYVSYPQNNGWTKAQKLESKINTENIDVAIGMADNGVTVFFYNGMRYKGNIYKANYHKGHFSEKMPLPLSINSKYQEIAASLSPDEKQLFFVSNRKDINFGGHDIYLSQRTRSGKWNTPLNIGNQINSPYDENFVFLHSDGKTLYFSSKGHSSMGGYDIFKSEYDAQSKTWQKPLNMGYPINTPADDAYFVLTADGKTAYFASNRDGGVGNFDIYKATFGADSTVYQCNKADSLRNVNHCFEHSLTYIHGRLADTLIRQKVQIEIEIFDVNNYKPFKKIKSDKKTGEFLFSLPTGFDYAVLYTAKKRNFLSESYLLEKDSTFNEFEKIIDLPKTMHEDKMELRNIYFLIGMEKMSPKSLFELEHLAQFMKKKRLHEWTIVVENTEYQILDSVLAENRALMIKHYLTKNGVAKRKIHTKSVGGENSNLPRQASVYVEVRRKKLFPF